MNHAVNEKRPKLWLTPLLAFLTMAACALLVVVYLRQAREPSYGGHRLSEWLYAYDTNLRFPDDHPPRSGFTDNEIETSLDAIGQKALPALLRWAQAKDSALKLKLNSALGHQRWIRFRFLRYSDRTSLAEAGFMYYGARTQPLEPALIKMTKDPDPDMRLMGYEAFFFSRPEKEVFLPVAYRALKEPDHGVQAMAAQWFLERFPQEAQNAGLTTRFPQFDHKPLDQAEKNSAPAPQ